MSWLNQYMEYTHQHESPAMFHLWSGLTIISALLGRKSYIEKGYYRLYPNLFTILVAGSARCRKSTSISIANGTLRDITDIRIVDGKTSSEKFVHSHVIPANAEQQTTLVQADELSVFLTRDQQGDKLIDTLTKFFDSPPIFTWDTFKHGKLTMRDIYVVVIAATTPDTLDKVLPDTAFGGGFTSRVLLVYQADTEKPRRDFQQLTAKDVANLESLRKGATYIMLHGGEFRLDVGARKIYDEWYESIKPPEDKRMDGFVGRKHDHALRVSMSLCGAEMDGSNIVLESHMGAAINLVEGLEAQLPGALDGIGSNSSGLAVMNQVSRILAHHTKMHHSDLLRKVAQYANAAEFRAVMDTLTQAGMVGRDKDHPNIYIWLGRGFRD